MDFEIENGILKKYEPESACVTVPKGVTEIGCEAFKGCSSIVDVDFTNNTDLRKIGDRSFQWCVNLKSIQLPDCVTEIGVCAFDGCTSLADVTLPNSLRKIGNGAFSQCYKLPPSITIPDGVTQIGNDAFLGCANLTDVTLPDSLKKIGRYAFLNLNFGNLPVTIHAPKGSYAEQYAKENGFAFQEV